jgi:transposase
METLGGAREVQVSRTLERCGRRAAARRFQVPRTGPPYPEEFKREAIELVRLTGKSIRRVARDVGISEVSLRNWVKQVDRDAGKRPGGLSSVEREGLRRLRRENQTLRMEREILKKPRLLRQGDRRAVGELFSFIAAGKAN